jgi:ribose transport system permease protein
MMAAALFAAMVGTGCNYLLAAAVVLLVLSVLGVIEGMVVSAGLNTLVTTLAAGAIIFGAVSGLTHGNDVTFRGHTISWIRNAHFLGLPAPVYFLFGVTILVSLVMHTTVLGRRIVLTGANSAAAHISGISVRAMTTAAFVIAAAGAALAGVLACSQVGAANVRFLPTLTVDAIAAVLIGGTSVAGGRGSPLRSAVGALIISAIVDLMIMHGLSIGRAEAVEGAILLAVVAVLRVFEKGSGR